MCNLFIDKIYLPGQLAGIYEVYSDQLSERKGLAGMPDSEGTYARQGRKGMP